MKTVTIEPDDSGSSRYGKSVKDLQTGISLHTGTYYGTLKHVTSYEEFSSDPTEKEGYYFALKLTNDGEGDIYTMITNGKMKDFKKVDDGFCVYRIRDPKTQKILVEYRDSESGAVLSEKKFTLYGLTLAEAEE